MNLKIDKLSYDIGTHMEELVNFKDLVERVSNIEGWRIATVHALNSKVIPTVARLQRQCTGIQKRIDAQSKFIGYNKYVYGIDGQQLNVRTECIDEANELDKLERRKEEMEENQTIHNANDDYTMDGEKPKENYKNRIDEKYFHRNRQQNSERNFGNSKISQVQRLFQVRQSPANQYFYPTNGGCWGGTWLH